MKKLLILLAGLSLLASACKKEQENTNDTGSSHKKVTASASCAATDTTAAKDGFKMYEMSEMAALMEQMYADNQRLRERIKNGDTIGSFPKHFVNIHSSAMTDPEENDAFFKEHARKFIAAQELIYKDPKNAEKHFNDAVTACVNCHEGKCEGPVARIKKLYIK